MILHIVNKSPQHAALNDALPFIDASDCLMLIDDGVYAALTGTDALDRIKQTGCRCVALLNDIQVRGLCIDQHISTVSMAEFVEITFAAEKSVSWY